MSVTAMHRLSLNLDAAIERASAQESGEVVRGRRGGVSGPLDFDLETGDIRTNYIGWEVAPIAGDLTKPALVPQRMYVLHDEPATDGVWIDLP